MPVRAVRAGHITSVDAFAGVIVSVEMGKVKTSNVTSVIALARGLIIIPEGSIFAFDIAVVHTVASLPVFRKVFERRTLKSPAS